MRRFSLALLVLAYSASAFPATAFLYKVQEQGFDRRLCYYRDQNRGSHVIKLEGMKCPQTIEVD